MDNDIVLTWTPAGKAIIQIWRHKMWQYVRAARPEEAGRQRPLIEEAELNDIMWIYDMPGILRYEKELIAFLKQSPGLSTDQILESLQAAPGSQRAQALKKQLQHIKLMGFIELKNGSWEWVRQ